MLPLLIARTGRPLLNCPWLFGLHSRGLYISRKVQLYVVVYLLKTVSAEFGDQSISCPHSDHIALSLKLLEFGGEWHRQLRSEH
jgi:hypothetical protein